MGFAPSDPVLEGDLMPFDCAPGLWATIFGGFEIYGKLLDFLFDNSFDRADSDFKQSKCIKPILED